MDAVRADKRVDEDRLPVLEVRLDGVAVIDEAHQAVPDVNALGRQRPKQGRQQVGAVHLVVRKPEGVDNRVGKRGTQEGTAVTPTALM